MDRQARADATGSASLLMSRDHEFGAVSLIFDVIAT